MRHSPGSTTQLTAQNLIFRLVKTLASYNFRFFSQALSCCWPGKGVEHGLCFEGSLHGIQQSNMAQEHGEVSPLPFYFIIINVCAVW